MVSFILVGGLTGGGGEITQLRRDEAYFSIFPLMSPIKNCSKQMENMEVKTNG